MAQIHNSIECPNHDFSSMTIIRKATPNEESMLL